MSIYGSGKILKLIPMLMISLYLITGCTEKGPEQKQEGKDRSEIAAKAVSLSIQQAEANNPEGLLKLYEIANDDNSYTVEYSEVANEKLHYFMYTKTRFWIKTFSTINLDKFKSYIEKSGVDAFSLPEGVVSAETLRNELLNNVQKIRKTDDVKVKELSDFIYETYRTKSNLSKKSKSRP